MSISDETLRVARQLRLTIKGIVDAETRTLVRAWARAWDGLAAEFDAAAADIVATFSEGRPATLGEVRRMTRARNALEAAQRSILTTFDAATVRIAAGAGEIVDVTRLLDARQMATQLPRSAGTRAELAVRFDRVNPEALEAIVERTTRQVTSAAWPLADEATEAMLRALVQAVPQGLSPRAAARRMVNAVEGRFNGGLARALTVARTEMLDAYRAAAGAQQAANADMLAGWVWSAQLDDRTCPSCIGMHGTEHSLEESGPDDHQNGRCARVPLVKPWRQLGFDLREPASVVRSGPEWFDGLPEDRQERIVGPARLEALKSGRVSWADLSQRRRTTGWRDSLVPTPVKDLVA